jgi:transcriptional antiterminator RfaH
MNPNPPSSPKKLLWYPVYTAPRAEKRVFSRLQEKRIEAFLPLTKTLRQWSDRKKWVEVPLFSSYVFVRIDYADRESVLQVPGTVRFIYFSGTPAFVPDDQMGWLRQIVQNDATVEATTQNFDPGEKVEVREGPFRGIAGELISRKGERIFVIRITGINYNLLLEIEPGRLRKTDIAKQ